MRKNFKKSRKSSIPGGPLRRIEASRQGFSFVEVILVVFILGTALTVFIQVISSSMVHSIGSRDTIIAAGLAQEGVELVKNVRDNNWAQKKTVFNGLNSNCKINYNYNPSDPCPSGSDEKLYLDGKGFYKYGSGLATKFSRRITVSVSGETKTVTSYVIWKDAFPNPLNTTTCNVANQCVYAQITLTKWGGE